MRQYQRHQPLQKLRHGKQPQRFWWVLLIILASLGGIYFYIIPFLASVGSGSSSASFSGGWSSAQQRQIAFDLAQNIQNYRQRINEGRRINYGDAYLEATGIPTPFRPPQPFDGMDSPTGATNDAHSEAKLKGWALATIRKQLQRLSSGSTINVIIFTQVKVCLSRLPKRCSDLDQAAPTGCTFRCKSQFLHLATNKF